MLTTLDIALLSSLHHPELDLPTFNWVFSLGFEMDQIVTEIKKIPPVTRFLTLSSIGVTLSAILKIVSPYTLIFQKSMVLKQFQVGYLLRGEWYTLTSGGW